MAEVVLLYVIMVVGLTIFAGIGWPWALVSAPVAMFALYLGLMLVVQVLWLIMLGLERVGTLLGLRKSPLA